MREFCIYYDDGVQISPDHWNKVTIMDKFNENTTLGEIREWYLKKGRHPKEKMMEEIKIQEL